jgi:hypothetical protein
MRSPIASSVGKVAVVTLLFFSQTARPPVFAQTPNSSPHPQFDPDRVARDLFQNEIEAENRDPSLWCFHEFYEEQKKLFTVCQTKDGEIDRLLQVNGRQLNSSQRQAEDQRIQRMVNHPDELRRKQKKEQDDTKQAQDLMRMFPDAFRFQYGGMHGNLMELKFSPNPDFHPSGRPAQVFHHMEGSLLLDPQQERLADISAQLTSEVKFGWGLFGHLDQGGTFHVKQQDLGSGHWEMTDMNIQMSGKVLFFKTIGVRQHHTYSDFREEPDGISPQQALEFLRQDPGFQ